mmetsp:Transcript_23394/g.45616  ORF Transcript_23394/g.45616 Transcript_23394/m.45616 type:complete len:111 (-) Transcript_23394:21-353(-)
MCGNRNAVRLRALSPTMPQRTQQAKRREAGWLCVRMPLTGSCMRSTNEASRFALRSLGAAVDARHNAIQQWQSDVCTVRFLLLTCACGMFARAAMQPTVKMHSTTCENVK